MSFTVRFQASYHKNPFRVALSTTTDGIVLRHVESTGEIAAAVHSICEMQYPQGGVQVEIFVNPPSWLHRGDLVRISPDSDGLEGTSTPFAQIVGFLPIGGIEIVHPEAGAGIYPPEVLSKVRAHEIDAYWIDQMTARSGIPVGSSKEFDGA